MEQAFQEIARNALQQVTSRWFLVQVAVVLDLLRVFVCTVDVWAGLSETRHGRASALVRRTL